MKLVEIGGVCFDAEGVDAFYPLTEELDENATFVNAKSAVEGDYGGYTCLDMGAGTFLLKATYDTVKVQMQMALRQTIGD